MKNKVEDYIKAFFSLFDEDPQSKDEIIKGLI
jgi:hypothetical protein